MDPNLVLNKETFEKGNKQYKEMIKELKKNNLKFNIEVKEWKYKMKEMEFNHKVGQIIRKLRNEHKITLKKLSNRTSISFEKLKDFENEGGDLSIFDLYNILKVIENETNISIEKYLLKIMILNK